MKNCIYTFLKEHSLEINEKFISEITITKIDNELFEYPFLIITL